MKHYGNSTIDRSEYSQITTIASGNELPNKEITPLLFFHTGNRHLFLGDRVWNTIPYGTNSMLKAYQAAATVTKATTEKLSDVGGTYLVANDVQLPVGAIVAGVPYIIKNISKKIINIIPSQVEETIDGDKGILINSQSCVTLQYHEGTWYIIGSHTS
jgi:hypothetical protein